MTLRLARAAMFAVVPAELVFAVLLIAGVPLPDPLLTATEAVLLVILLLTVLVVIKLYGGARRAGASRRAALIGAYEQLVPEQVRRIMGFDLKGTVSLGLWIARRRHGVPPGAVAASYSRAQTATMLMFLFAMVVELVGVDLLLRAIGWPDVVRISFLVIDGYSILAVLAIVAACITRPHVISADELRIRYGAFFDLRVPRELIATVRQVQNFNESGMVKVDGDRLAVVVASQTNLVVELAEPITAVRPLGRRAQVRTVRFFADEPRAALAALATRPSPDDVASSPDHR